MNINFLMDNMPENIDSALIITPENRRYFTEFSSSDGILVVTRKGSIFFTDSRYIEAAEKTITCCEVSEGKKVYKQICDFLNAKGAKNIAVEQSGITLAQFENLKQNENLKSFEIIGDNSLDKAIGILRQVKSPVETEKIK